MNCVTRLVAMCGLLSLFATLQPVVSTAYAADDTVCTEGKLHVLSGRAIRLDGVLIEDTEDALRMASGTTRGPDGKVEFLPPKDYSIPLWQLWKQVRAGKSDKDIRRFGSFGTVTWRIFYTDTARFPDRIYHVTNDDICLGSVAVKKYQTFVEFTVPVTNGGHHPLVPREAFLNNKDAVLACFTTNGFNIHDYEKTKGPMAGQPNTICGMPGTISGTTHMSQAAREGQRWVMWTALVKMDKRLSQLLGELVQHLLWRLA